MDSQRKKILVIDDEENFARLIKLNLESTGRYEVKTESKGALSLETAKKFKPDLIFLDILMSDVGGDVVACQLKDDQETENIPIVFLTAVAKREEVEESSGVIGGHPFIAKPAGLQQLIAVIEKNAS